MWIGTPLVLLLVLLLAALGFVVSTQTGLETLLSVVKRVAPGELTYDHLEGRLIGPLELNGFRYHDGPLNARIDRASFDWRPSELMQGLLHIERLAVKGVSVQLPPSEPEPETEPFVLADIALPIKLRIDGVDIDEVRIQPDDSTEAIVIDAVHLVAHTEDQSVVLESLQVRTPDGRLEVDGELEPRGDYPLTVNVDWTFEVPDLGPLAGRGSVTGTLQSLELTQSVSGAVVAKVDARLRDALDEPSWTAKVDLTSLELGKLSPDLTGAIVSGSLKSEGTLDDYQANGRFSTRIAEVGPVAVEFQAMGGPETATLKALEVTAGEKPMSLELQGQLQLADLQFDASGTWNELAWPLIGAPQVQSPEGRVRATGTPQDYRLNLEAVIASPELERINAILDVTGTDQALQVSKLSLVGVQGKPSLNARGQFTFANGNFEASGDWQDLAWPLSDTPQVESAGGKFKAKGNLERYEFTLDSDFDGPEIPSSSLQLQGRGTAESLESVSLQVGLLGGQIDAQANARWEPQVSWEAKIAGSGLDPGKQWPGMEGSLRFRLRSSGHLSGAGDSLQATAVIEELAGSLHGQNLSGKGNIAVQNQDLTIDALSLVFGDASLAASGQIAERWNLDWKLGVPNLGRLLPGAAGRIESSGTVTGPRTEPMADIKLSVNELVYGTERLKQLRADARIDLTGATRSEVNISGTDMLLGGQPWSDLNVEGSGTPAAHSMSARIAGDLGAFALAIGGGMADRTWQGRVEQLSATDTAAGSWNLERPTELRASETKAGLEQACLRSDPSRICIEGGWSEADGSQGRVLIERLTFSRFKELLPPDLEINTSLGGEVNGKLLPDGAVYGKVDLTLAPGSVSTLANGNSLTIALRTGVLRASADGKDATAQLRLDLDTLGSLDGNVQIRDLTSQGRVSGSVKGEFRDLQFISAFAPQIQNASGRILVNLDLTGALPIPDMAGVIRLENAAVEIPEVGTKIESINFELAGTGTEGLRISGSARSGSGELELSGSLDPKTRKAEIAIKGQDFQIADTSEIQASISPDMTVRMTEGEVRVDGELRIPKAFLSPPDVSSGISPSSDVVIVKTADGESLSGASQHLAIFVKLRIILGDDVRVEAAELKAKLQGSLLVEQTPQLPPRGTGAIQIEAGKYRLYGQEIEIQRGRVLFASGPLDNPGLDMRVARTVDDVTVGATVTGTLNKPRLQLFSDPSMSDNNILSYLLFGREPNSSSGSESQALLAAATALGTSGGNQVTKQLKDTLGLDAFRFESGEGSQDASASLLLGKYLAPDLYVSYGVGLFEAVNTFTMRYRINDWLSVETSASGGDSGGDVLYSIEK